MKRLLLLRHAKAAPGEPNGNDFDRPLAARGEKDASRIGRLLRQRGARPDRILCSPAARARRTCELVAEEARLDVPPLMTPEIYNASVAGLADLVRRLPDDAGCVLLVGHNPGMEQLLTRMTGRDEPMSTATLACIAFDEERWKEVRHGWGTLEWRLTSAMRAADE